MSDEVNLRLECLKLSADMYAAESVIMGAEELYQYATTGFYDPKRKRMTYEDYALDIEDDIRDAVFAMYHDSNTESDEPYYLLKEKFSGSYHDAGIFKHINDVIMDKLEERKNRLVEDDE